MKMLNASGPRRKTGMEVFGWLALIQLNVIIIMGRTCGIQQIGTQHIIMKHGFLNIVQKLP